MGIKDVEPNTWPASVAININAEVERGFVAMWFASSGARAGN
jgi:hypothetical protein